MQRFEFNKNNRLDARKTQDARRAHPTANKNKGRRGTPTGNNTNKPGGGRFRLPSWLDYCFEYEAVTLGGANKDNNTAYLNSPW